MRILLSDQVYKDINKLYNYKVYLTDNQFCQSFVFYVHKVANDFDTLAQGRNTFSYNRGFRYSRLSTIDVNYKLLNGNVILVKSIGFIGLLRLYRMCSFERRGLGITRGRRPTHIKASINPSDYKMSNLKATTYNLTPRGKDEYLY